MSERKFISDADINEKLAKSKYANDILEPRDIKSIVKRILDYNDMIEKSIIRDNPGFVRITEFLYVVLMDRYKGDEKRVSKVMRYLLKNRTSFFWVVFYIIAGNALGKVKVNRTQLRALDTFIVANTKKILGENPESFFA